MMVFDLFPVSLKEINIFLGPILTRLASSKYIYIYI